MPSKFEIKQWEEYDGDDDDHWWKWAVWIEASAPALDGIEAVEWRLHPTFRDPVRKVTDRASKFRLETGGWGVFQIVARLYLKNGKTTALRHYLKLHFPDGSENRD
jgi:transcription initiation factor IIF auxiliary subunit